MGAKKLMSFSSRWQAFAISTIYFVLIMVEFILHLKGKSLCHESSCKIVMGIAGSEKDMLIAGMVYFALLSVFFATDRFSLAALLSLCGVSAESVFLMRQCFEYHTFCPFCLIIAAGVMAVAFLSFGLMEVSMKEIVMAGAMLASFELAFVLTKVPVSPIKKDKVLIYSPSCPHCERVIRYCKERGIDLSLCRGTNVRGILYCLGVKGVPALLVRKQGEVRIIEGEDSVMAYLTEPQQSRIPLFSKFRMDSGVCSVGRSCR